MNGISPNYDHVYFVFNYPGKKRLIDTICGIALYVFTGSHALLKRGITNMGRGIVASIPFVNLSLIQYDRKIQQHHLKLIYPKAITAPCEIFNDTERVLKTQV